MFNAASPQISKKLCDIFICQRFRGFQFHNQLVFNQDINTISTIEVDSFILNGKRVLQFEPNFLECQFPRQTLLLDCHQ